MIKTIQEVWMDNLVLHVLFQLMECRRTWSQIWLVLWSMNFMTFHIPSGYVNSLLWKMAIEIVDLPVKNGDFP